mmetsp:Transcript_13911/g.33045  ORF Transcript_13911/g.33045 Transcript_13911/m.33045 type:complete len:245 (+) Transcript_13911:12-746(+)
MLPALAGTRALLLRSRVRPNCLLTLLAPFIVSAPTSTAMSRYRADGVRITHDPYAPGMKETYGAPGQTDRDGFDPYADSVGAGIYGGKVKRDAEGNILIGQQYQNHNPTPGPIYSGEGYTEMSNALHKGESAIAALLEKDPALVNEISTGGAQPLHMAGMSQRNQHATEFLISKGGNIEAEDTYGYRPLHRMASNNLAIGAMALCKAGADVNARTSRGETPLSVAMSSAARDVIAVLKQFGATR